MAWRGPKNWESVIVIESTGFGSGTRGADSLVTSDYRSFLLWGIGDTEHWYAETIPYTANDLSTLHLHILT